MGNVGKGTEGDEAWVQPNCREPYLHSKEVWNFSYHFSSSKGLLNMPPPLHPSQPMHHLQSVTHFIPPHPSLPWLPRKSLPLRLTLTWAPVGYLEHADLILSLYGTRASHGSLLAFRGNPKDLVIESLQGGWDWE